ncbi:MAG: VOC family protein [Halobacteriales archaeon]|nr:VOC family protein [Halobacteriales archaeon]
MIPLVTTPKNGVNIFVDNVEKNTEYFTRTLGFTEVERMEREGRTIHAQVAFGRGASSFGVGLASTKMVTQGSMDYDFGAFGRSIKNSPDTLGNGVFLYFRVPNVDTFHSKIKKNGAIIDEPPTDQEWGERTISVLTPDGYYMTFAQPIKGWKPTPEEGITLYRGGKRVGGKGTTRATTRSKRR